MSYIDDMGSAVRRWYGERGHALVGRRLSYRRDSFFHWAFRNGMFLRECDHERFYAALAQVT